MKLKFEHKLVDSLGLYICIEHFPYYSACRRRGRVLECPRFWGFFIYEIVVHNLVHKYLKELAENTILY